MQLRYDEDLIEAAVFFCATRRNTGVPPLQATRFHREREKLYGILDPDERNAAFFKLHLDWFREWNLEKALLDLLAEFPVLRKELDVLAFRKARGRTEEGAELYVNAENGGRNAVVALRAVRFEHSPLGTVSHEPEPPAATLSAFLRHEFMHLSDMLDAGFGYSPHLDLPVRNAAQQCLIRERYRLLWDVTIDGRLTHSARAAPNGREQHRATFDRAFAFWPESRREEVFASLWNGRSPHHCDLLAIAADPRELRDAQTPLPGAPCPLCGFPTFEWAPENGIRPEVMAVVCGEFPQWTPLQGLCNRCLKVYEVAVCRVAAA